MTAKTKRPAAKRPTKSAKAQARKPSARRSAKDARTPVRTVDLQQQLFSAAFGCREVASFGSACASLVAEALAADAAAVTMLDASSGQPNTFATSEVAYGLAAGNSARSPLMGSLKLGQETTMTIVTAFGARKAHDSLAHEQGWRRYMSVPLKTVDGSITGAVVAYFSAAVDLAKKRKEFESQLARPLAAAIAARQKAQPDSFDAHQFNSLASTIPGVVYQRIVYPDGNIRYTYLSEGAREMFGVDPDAVVKDPNVLFSTFTKDYAETFRPRLMEASKALKKWDVEASMILPDGRRRTTHAIARPERRADGSVLWTGVILDASRAKEAEEKLLAANRQVGIANEAKSAFLAKMSHEMRTPLNGVLGMGDLLLKTELTPRQSRLATTLCESAKGLLGIINDVLDLSRIEAGQFKLDFQDFNLRHCIEDAVELCATAGYRKGLEINLIVAQDAPIGVKSDPVRLRQVLINLIGNAIKFTESGEVVVRLSGAGAVDGKTAVTFEVADTGIGIDEAAIGRLFEPFAQADSTISRRFGGTGLGLSITRHLVELLGGTVGLTSKRGQGTTVRFTIPFEVTASAQTTSILSHVSLEGVRALVVDDRASNREMMQMNLVGSGAIVDCAASEEEALLKLTDGANNGAPYRIAIIDRTRPRTSSLHFCRTIRCDNRLEDTALVVLMSPNWNANPVDQQGLVNTTFLSKPLRRTDLVAAMAHMLSLDTALAKSAQPMVSASAQRAAAPSLKLRVLLVEDNATNIEVAREYLSEMDCRITVAVNGIEALSAFDRSTFDVILMDSQMPEMDGLTATRRIRDSERLKSLKRTPILAVTANAYESDRQQAIEAGSDDFLSKPYSELQLRALLIKWGRPNGAEVPVAVAEPVAAAPAASTPGGALDEAMHASLMQSRPAFLNRLIKAFLSSLPETATALASAMTKGDAELLRSVAHSLKSGSANVGAKQLSELCRVLDMKLRLGADAADCETMVAAISDELGTAQQALEGVLRNLPVDEATRKAAAQ